MLLERGREVAAIDDLLGTVGAGSGAAVLVHGEPGIGKSRLLAEARARALDRGLLVATAAGAVLEGEFPFGVVRQLLEPLAADPAQRGRLLAGAGAAAARVLAPAALDAPLPDERFAVLHGLFWAFANAASQQPLLLCIDDLQWVDEPSLRLIDYLARRVGGLPIGVLAARRSGEPARGDSARVLDEMDANSSIRLLHPARLSRAAVRELTRVAFGPNAAESFVSACHERTAGNPLFVHELQRELRDTGVEPNDAGAERVAALAPRAVGRVVLARLARLGPEVVTFARVLSLLADGSELLDAAELAGLAAADAVAAARTLIAAGIVNDRGGLGFAHPLMRDAIAADSSEAVRAEFHGRAARVLATHGRDVDVVAAHLLASSPAADPWVVEQLRAAARTAVDRGAPDAALPLLRRALDEPPAASATAAVLAELGEAEAELQRPDAAQHLIAARDLLAPGTERARVGLALARQYWLAGRFRRTRETLLDAQNGLGPDDRELSLLLEAMLLGTGALDPTAPPDPDHVAELAGLPGTTPGERAVLGRVAFEMAKRGSPASDAIAVAERAIAGGWGYAVAPDALTPLFIVSALHWCSSIARAVELATALIDEARALGSATLFAEASAARALARWRGGAPVEAEADARQALSVVGTTSGQMQDLATHVLIGTLTDRGELSAALETAARWQSGDRHARRSMGVVVACSQGRLELALGRPEQALARLEPAGATIEATGCVNPAGGEWRQPAALALAALDRTAEARELLSPALVAARRSGGAYELGVTLRAAALIEQPVNTDLLEEALGVLAPSEIRLQHARVLVDYGAALRRSGHRRDARDPLAAALEIAHACGAAEIAERARTELLATGARPRRIERTGADALTPSELRVARLARDGLSNREIAQQLFVSPRTVEAQLRTAYQKLGIGSRSELDGHGLSAPRPSARGARRRTLRQ